jgi:hypothetical protein
MLLPVPMMRLVMCLLALCVGLQGMALSSMRALGRSHYHLAPSTSAPDWGRMQRAPAMQAVLDWVKTLQPPVPNALFVHQRASADTALDPGHQHAHATRAHHAHDAHDRSAVWVADDDGSALQNQATLPSRALHDLDALPAHPVLAAQATRPEAWAALDAVHVQSHITAPLKRPPKA